MEWIEVQNCRCAGEIEHQEAPLTPVRWSDGREDQLTLPCAASGLDTRTLVARWPVVADLVSWNDAGTPLCFFKSQLALVTDDVFLGVHGDVDEQGRSYWYRGDQADVVASWINESDMSHLPVAELALCQHYGLLDEVPDNQGTYPVPIFLARDAEMWAEMYLGVSLSDEALLALVPAWEAAGLTWPRDAANAATDESAAWLARLSPWLEEVRRETATTLNRESLLLTAHGLDAGREPTPREVLIRLDEHTRSGCFCNPEHVRRMLLPAALCDPLPASYTLPDVQASIPAVEADGSWPSLIVLGGACFIHVGSQSWAIPDPWSAGQLLSLLGNPQRIRVEAGTRADAAWLLLPWSEDWLEATIAGDQWFASRDGAFPYGNLEDLAIAGIHYEFIDGSGSAAADDEGEILLIEMGGQYWTYSTDPGTWERLNAAESRSATREFMQSCTLVTENEGMSSRTWGI